MRSFLALGLICLAGAAVHGFSYRRNPWDVWFYSDKGPTAGPHTDEALPTERYSTRAFAERDARKRTRAARARARRISESEHVGSPRYLYDLTHGEYIAVPRRRPGRR